MDKKNIIGIWKPDPNDQITLDTYGNISMEFKNNGELIYTVYENGKQQKMYMIFEIHENILITDQPSAPNKSKSMYEIMPNGKLEIYFEGIKSVYIKLE